MNVMKKAWEIAKDGVVKFGGKVKEYFAEALKMAWVIVKTEAGAVEIELPEGSRKHKTWVAEILGTDAKWGFNRQFLVARESATIRGKWYDLEEGKIYDVNGYNHTRAYLTVKNGEVVELAESEVKAVFA